jgi:two-component system response regulator AtoC
MMTWQTDLQTYLRSSRMGDKKPKTTVMIVEDDEATRRLLTLACRAQGYDVVACASGTDALSRISALVAVIILDLGLPDMDGPRLLQELLRDAPWVPCLVLTARDSARSAVDCIKAGARDYFTKPVNLGRLFEAVRDVTAGVSPALLKTATHPRRPADQNLWNSEAGRECHSLALTAASSGSPLLISGESGTGRMAIARMVHSAGANHTGPLLILNAANPEDSCLVTELFGKAGGGAEGVPIRGLLHKCGSGTLVITAVEKLPLSLQSKLEKALVSGRYQQQGSNTSIQFNCRITCITSANLEAETASRRFSRRLWFALRNMHIRLPSLKSRIEDLPLFCARFLTEFCVANHTPRPEIPSSTMELLLRHHWPGNLDELRHSIEAACKSCKGPMITASDLPQHLWDPTLRVENAERPVVGSARIEEVERASLVVALSLCGGNRRLVAQRLGVSLRTIYNMLRRHQLSPPKTRNQKSDDLSSHT